MPGYMIWILASIILFLMVWLGISLRSNKQLKKQLTGMREAQNGQLIKTIDHHRHDWVNDVQVLFGYIQLNKQDKLRPYVDSLNEKIRRESLISKLDIPFLIAYIMSFRANTNALILDVRLEHEITLSRFDEQGMRVARLLIAIIEAYKTAAGPGEGDVNRLSITMNVWDGQLSVGYEYDGISDIDILKANIQEIIEQVREYPDIEVVVIVDTDHVMDIEMRVGLAETAG